MQPGHIFQTKHTHTHTHTHTVHKQTFTHWHSHAGSGFRSQYLFHSLHVRVIKTFISHVNTFEFCTQWGKHSLVWKPFLTKTKGETEAFHKYEGFHFSSSARGLRLPKKIVHIWNPPIREITVNEVTFTLRVLPSNRLLCFDSGRWVYEFQVRKSQFLENNRLLWSFFFLFLKSLMVHSVSSVCEFMCPVVSGVKSTMLVLWALGRGVQSGCWYCHTMNYSTVSRYHCLSAASSLVVLPIKNTHNCPLLAGINHCTCMNNTCGADKWNVITVSQKFLSQNRDIRFCSWWF